MTSRLALILPPSEITADNSGSWLDSNPIVIQCLKKTELANWTSPGSVRSYNPAWQKRALTDWDAQSDVQPSCSLSWVCLTGTRKKITSMQDHASCGEVRGGNLAKWVVLYISWKWELLLKFFTCHDENINPVISKSILNILGGMAAQVDWSLGFHSALFQIHTGNADLKRILPAKEVVLNDSQKQKLRKQETLLSTPLAPVVNCSSYYHQMPYSPKGIT